MATPVNNSAWLDWMTALVGGKSRQRAAAVFPPDRFYCLLDELPLHLVPPQAFRSVYREADRKLYLNPECSLCVAEDVPEEVASCRNLLAGFALQGTIAWVRDQISGSLLPFWLGPELECAVHYLRCDGAGPASLPANVRLLLAAAGILISEEQGHSNRPEIRNTSAQFQEKGYAVLGNLIHPLHVAALRRYYRYLIRTGAIHLGDGQSGRRYVAHNEPVARFFHHQIGRTLSEVAGEPLKPSYVYMASYLGGAELKKHVDREQCEFSVTLCLDFSPEPKLATPWPIRLDTATGTVTVYQLLGDGLAYRGTRLPHYRSALGEGQTSTSVFFHYVSQDFAGPLS